MTRLILPVGKRDHSLGEEKAAITLVEYGNYECSHCAQTERIVTQLRQRLNGDLRFVYRHFPRGRPHSASQRAAEAAEAAGAQGKFWQMHRLLFEHTHHLDDATIALCAATLELDMSRFLDDLKRGVYAEKVREDFQSGLRSGVNGTPTFYINGVRHDDYWEVDTLLIAMESSLMATEDQAAYSDARQQPVMLLSLPSRRSVLVRSAAAVFGLVLLAVPGYTQTVPATVAGTAINHPLPTKRHTAAKANTNCKETKMTATMTQCDTAPSTATDAIHPFHVYFPQEALNDLRHRLAATRWPEQETVNDHSQGVPLATMKELVHYWGTDYDWRKCEAKLNALPQFMTNIDGLDIHFIHVRSKHPNALPLIITHGWPGSIIEQLKVIGPLTDPTAYGGRAEDAFDVVIPSLPGYGFSGKPTAPGWNPVSIARAWDTLMKRLGYTHYVAQGGDWGNAVSEVMALQQPQGLLGISTNMAATVPADVSKALALGGPPPAGLSADEQHAWDQQTFFYKKGLGYANEMSLRPQTLYGLADSPANLAAWMLDHDAASLALIARVFDGQSEGLTRDDILDNITLYWLTNTGISSGRLYWDTSQLPGNGGFFDARGIKIPVAVSAFPDEIYEAPQSWAERAYPKLLRYDKHDKGGHFAAWEQPEALTHDLREAFRSLR